MTYNNFDPAGTDSTTLPTIAGKVDQSSSTVAGNVHYKTLAGAGRGTGPGIEVITGATAGDTAYFGVPCTVTTDLAMISRVYVQFPDSASFGTGNTLIEFLRIRAGTTGSGTNVVRFLVATSDNTTYTPGTLFAQNSTGGPISGTASPVMVAGLTYKLELGSKPATSTTGSILAKMYNDAETLLWDLAHTAADINAGTAVPTRVIVGKVAGTGANFKMWATQVGTDSGSTIPTITSIAKNNVLNNPTFTIAPSNTGPVARGDGTGGTTYTITLSATGGNANPKTYAIKVDYSALGDFTDTVNKVDTTGSYQSSPVFTYTPTLVGKHRVTPYAQQAA